MPDEFFLVENLFEIVQYKFPLLILQELEGKDYRFIGDVATLGKYVPYSHKRQKRQIIS